jgi:thioredoxin reductase
MRIIETIGAVIGAGPKGISMLIQLQREFPNQFVGLETQAVVGSWESQYAGTSPTRTGIYYSDTIVPGKDIPWNLENFARSHPLMTKEMLEKDILPKEVLQDYYRMAADALNIQLFLGQAVTSIWNDGDIFHIQTEEILFKVKYVIISTGPVNHKVFPEWASNLKAEVCQHSIGHGMFERVEGQKILLVGGGHATPDIACRMWELGASVTVVIRKEELKVNYLPYPDAYISPMYWSEYKDLSVPDKLAILHKLQKEGPWVTPRSYNEFMQTLHLSQNTEHPIEFFNGTFVTYAVIQKQDSTENVEVHFHNGYKDVFDKVICATGFKANVMELPFIDRSIWDGVVTEGLPHLNNDYSLKSMHNLFFLGYLSQLGPRGIVDSILHHSQYSISRISNSIKCKEVTSFVSFH